LQVSLTADGGRTSSYPDTPQPMSRYARCWPNSRWLVPPSRWICAVGDHRNGSASAYRRLAWHARGHAPAGRRRALLFHHYLGNRIISTLFDILYNQLLTDIEVCYKMFTREVLESLRLSANDFGFEVQFSAQVALARRWRIYELGISYYGRTFEEGKKINWRDGIKALWYLLRFRFGG
jgi:hypothetical protein